MSRLSSTGQRKDAARLRGIQNVLGDRYAIRYRIGGGVAADVYLAQDRQTGQAVAIKVFSGFSSKGLAAERFIREARVTALLDHSNILRVLESGVDAGLLYYVMPFAESGTLADVMAGRKRMSVRRVCKILGGVGRCIGVCS